MISRRSLVLAFAVATLPAMDAAAQVQPLGEVADETTVQPASHFGYEPGVHVGHYGTVWGTDCLNGSKPHRPMFPPCPNPCRTTLLGELFIHTRLAVDKTFDYLFGPCGLCGCLTCHGGCCDDGAYLEGGEYVGSEVISEGEPVPATEGDPFKDDPVTGSGTKSTMRSLLPRATQARARSHVRRVTHVEAVPQTRRTRPTATARPISNPGYRPAPRPIEPRQLLRARSMPALDTEPTLRFREE